MRRPAQVGATGGLRRHPMGTDLNMRRPPRQESLQPRTTGVASSRVSAHAALAPYALSSLAPRVVAPSESQAISLSRAVGGRLAAWLEHRYGHVFEAMHRAEERVERELAGLGGAADVPLALDDLAFDETVLAGVRALHELAASRWLVWLTRIVARGFRTPDYWRSLGPVAAQHMAFGMVYGDELDRAVAQVSGWSAHLPVQAADGLRDALYSPDTPAVVVEALVRALRVTPALLALGPVRRAPGRYGSAVLVELAEAFHLGQRDALRLVAATPGVRVSPDVLPEHERFDVAALDRAIASRNARWDALPVRDRLDDEEDAER